MDKFLKDLKEAQSKNKGKSEGVKMVLPNIMHNEEKKEKRVSIKIDAQNIDEDTLR